HVYIIGFLVYSLFQGTAQQTIAYIEAELERNHHIMGWLSPYNMRNNYTQNWYLGQIQFFVGSLHSQIKSIEISLRKELSKLFFDNTVDEFIYLTISPTVDRLQKYLDEVKRLSALRVYPRRPFRIS
ncbi:hypothetical protein OSTOST_15327, partial [Ostertagia ostertagi]